MLTGLYITLRFGHFISLMLAFGCVLYGAWWAPVPLRRVLMLRFYPLLRPLLLIGAISTLALYLLQGGMMGEGWTDVWRPAVAGGGRDPLWWSVDLADPTGVDRTRGSVDPSPSRRPPAGGPAGGTAAAFRRGRARRYARWSHRRAAADKPRCASLLRRQLVWRSVALYLLPAPGAGRWRPAAVYTMARFSRYGHLAVAGTIASGALNALLIQGGLIGASPWGRMLLIKCALVAGMVVIALVNRYVLVPRMSASGSQAESLILRTTQAEIGLGALALLAVSLFATWEPY